ncbi:MAG: AMP-binding protein, partial [SAR324 cluster bacterium]|nr:AMP-binding protein [SAR324 cluster bacterium]
MTAHLDLFVQHHLPAQEELPDFINLENFDYPEILNCATPLLDDAVKEGYGSKEVVLMNEGSWTYSDLQKDSNQIARVLLEDLNLKPGNRVLLWAPNSYPMFAAWFGVIKAGGIAVSTMPLLRSMELNTIINKARVSIALCDTRLLEELEQAMSESCLEQLISFRDGDLEEKKNKKSVEFENLPTSRNDPCLIAFTSGTTG